MDGSNVHVTLFISLACYRNLGFLEESLLVAAAPAKKKTISDVLKP